MIILKYFIWHYTKAIKNIFKICGNFIKFFWLYFFPVPTLLRTLLKPWKRTGKKRQISGFDIKILIEKINMNRIYLLEQLVEDMSIYLNELKT